MSEIFNSDYLLQPVNKIAAVVSSQAMENKEIDRIFEEYDCLTRALKAKTEQILNPQFIQSKKQRRFLDEERQKIAKERNELKAKYPFIGKNKRGFQNFLVDEAKKRLSQEEWHACVRMAEKNMADYYSLERGQCQ